MTSPKPGEKRQVSPTAAPVDKKAKLDLPSTHREEALSNELSSAGPSKSSTTTKKPSRKAVRTAQKNRKKLIELEPCSRDDIYWHEINDLLGKDAVDEAIEAGSDLDAPFGFREEVDLVISELSSNGEGIAKAPPDRKPWAVIIPFTLPGERVRARIYRHARLLSFADLVSVEEPNTDMRDMSAVRCRYFGTCAGCQYQMLSYDMQLQLKRNVVVKAYGMFSDLPSTSVPPILPTSPSPLQYGYRTKITPHFDTPEKVYKKHAKNKKLKSDAAASENGDAAIEVDGAIEPKVDIGFNQVGKREVMDIEECPIATPILNEVLGPMRERIQKNMHLYKKGVSLLLRDSLEISPSQPTLSLTPGPSASVANTLPHLQPTPNSIDEMNDLSGAFEKHVCVTDHRATVRERVGTMLFDYPGGQFFQNNNSVLVSLVEYVRDAIFPAGVPTVVSEIVEPSATTSTTDVPTHLVDAYCGSGFFSVMLSPHFTRVAGIELSADAIRFATHNASLNSLPTTKCTFLAGDASAIFATVQDFPRARTAVLIDPPRKGCDEAFLKQLRDFRPEVVVYVSCNVHTQARDVGALVRESKMESEVEGKKGIGWYRLESVRGFDLFPQTAHVESVAVLRLVK
ncbi:S-adenosyl-L-methionine-dependent methyltransferase [Rickenella mellea]|uniref:S-adenosyl-L-methionine-dependent methyltransferase n=1 Tax=Rickenella mellea TaxID=50990 RepID=A0A4Y7Q4V3_9AGAM|nr:S-adenosyl-L-methionine-dependent methyltransferase [Rickenella mellea]